MKDLPEMTNISPIKMADLNKYMQDCDSSNGEDNNFSHSQKTSVIQEEDDPDPFIHQESIRNKRIKVSKNVRFNVEILHTDSEVELELGA